MSTLPLNPNTPSAGAELREGGTDPGILLQDEVESADQEGQDQNQVNFLNYSFRIKTILMNMFKLRYKLNDSPAIKSGNLNPFLCLQYLNTNS